MVAARSLPESGDSPPLGGGIPLPRTGAPLAVTPPAPSPSALRALAGRWLTVLPDAGDPDVDRLSELLVRLATALRAEPFWPLAARGVGAELLTSGLCGERSGMAGSAPEDTLPGTLGLLRDAGPAAFGVPGPEGERRLTLALDELAAGFSGALRMWTHRAQEGLLLATLRAREGVERALAASETHYRAIYTQGPVGIAVGDLDGMIIDLNPAACRMIGLTAPPELPRPATDYVHPDDFGAFASAYRRLGSGVSDTVSLDIRVVGVEGVVVWAHLTASLIRGSQGRPSNLIAVIEDVSERYRLRSRLVRASSEDRLTRLPNRTLIEESLRQAFVPGAARRVALCALDVDGFTRVNDDHGHRVGDELLSAIAGRLRIVADPHLVARTGGDEFGVLVVDPDGVAGVAALADRIVETLAAPFEIGGRSLAVTASVGVAEDSTTRVCPEELLRAASVALSWAKGRGGGTHVVFDPERDAGESARSELLNGLVDAIGHGEFRLAYQPLVHLVERDVRGVEALVRWQHPSQGLIGPGRFIELAERSGAIVPLGRWVLGEACREAARWYGALGPRAPYVSVNVSPLQLPEPGWVDEVAHALEVTGLPADRLQLEITEQAVLGDEPSTMDALAELRAAGVRLALDDFGTGYSSLAWLRRLPVHALKIDGSFIDGLRHADPDPVDRSIVASLIQMAHALGLEVTAEWVETAVQAERLAELGCDLGQGRWFGDAGPARFVPGLGPRTIE
ncbi:MAG TPA: bifunctional diguanylate cyclase/phosphodiesterase [Pseudonocardia sp.]|nr:bifunctional diguanylate cyclase/phosphodiesterase [Pseudonocardia sp.]